MTNLTHNSFLCIYFNSLHVSSNLVLIIRRINCINTTSGICHTVSVTVSCAGRRECDIYQMLYWYNWFSWWWARGCLKHVENWNKYIKKNCASSWSFTKNQELLYWTGRDSAVSIATRYELDGQGIESRWARDFPHPSRPTLGPTQPPIQLITGLSRGLSSRGVALTTHPHLAPRLKKEKSYTSTPPKGLRGLF